MRTPQTLVDTDILSQLMKADPNVVKNASLYLQEHQQLTLSIITKYEIYRGLKAKSATAQLQRFTTFTENCEVLPLTDDIVDIASDIYGALSIQGALIGDADIFIAATAIANSLVLATNNTKHFSRISNLTIVNWT